MAHKTRMTLPTALVLCGIDRGLRYGFDLIDASGLGAGTVYPMLRRLEDAGLLIGAWEKVARAREEGRPPRRYYRLTPSGEAKLREALERYPIAARTFEASPGAGEPRHA